MTTTKNHPVYNTLWFWEVRSQAAGWQFCKHLSCSFPPALFCPAAAASTSASPSGGTWGWRTSPREMAVHPRAALALAGPDRRFLLTCKTMTSVVLPPPLPSSSRALRGSNGPADLVNCSARIFRVWFELTGWPMLTFWCQAWESEVASAGQEGSGSNTKNSWSVSPLLQSWLA